MQKINEVYLYHFIISFFLHLGNTFLNRIRRFLIQRFRIHKSPCNDRNYLI
ncbi:hypothetical protein BACPEC_00773 [[Bacteroides] pectinophilus ATCC 43243]|uniref:Uncharacterized protein n=1 Tax=[Bacteroides] pectinophilus ATCC 43243 TaxID=483218 RepID=B7AQ17_9FIRM|nr:hypothetical protein BACPEC_00773 [[Bacteroides] pectinophilus ATCC 43243]